MARDITLLNHRPLTTSSHLGIAVGGLLLSALAIFMCASTSRSRQWRRWKACYGSQDPVIHLNPEEIISYQYGDVDGEGPVWKKNILMGEKCQLPDFSGVIIYDSAGNAVKPAKPQIVFQGNMI